MSRICTQPFLYAYPNGAFGWRPCCKTSYFPIKKTNFEDWFFNDPDLNLLRSEMFSDGPKEFTEKVCKQCLDLERSGAESYRTRSLNHITPSLQETILNFLDTGKINFFGRDLIFKIRIFGNQCNLGCYMCNPVNSTVRKSEVKLLDENIRRDVEGDELELEDINIDEIVETILKYSEYTHQINISGGEPFIIKKHYELLNKLVESGDSYEIGLHYNSNVTDLNNFLDYSDKFKYVVIQASVDNLYEKNDWMRYPSNFDKILTNIKLLKSKKINLSINITWSILNIMDVIEILEFWEHNKISVNPLVNFVEYPRCLDFKNLPNNLKQILIDKYSNYQNTIVKTLISRLKYKRDEKQFRIFLEYMKNLDKIRNTDYLNIFPNLQEYVNVYTRS